MPVAITWMRDGEHPTVNAAMIASGPTTLAARQGFTQQIDANPPTQAIGAPIVDASGTLVGVVTASHQGDYLSLPTVHVRRLIAAASGQDPSDIERGNFGVVLGSGETAVISGVSNGSPAQQTEIEQGDRIIKVGQYDVKSALDVVAAVAMARAGDRLRVVVRRGDETIENTVTLKAQPGGQPLASNAGPTIPGTNQQTLEKLEARRNAQEEPLKQFSELKNNQ